MNLARTFRVLPARYPTRGFTLIEVMIVVAIVAILTAIALPSYQQYVIRGKIVPQTNALAGMRALMEQYYQDNRQYTTITTPATINNPCDDTTVQKVFDTYTLSCSPVPTTTTYTLVATANAGTPAYGAVYTVDQTNTMATTGMPASWGAVPSLNHCWIMKKGDSCTS